MIDKHVLVAALVLAFALLIALARPEEQSVMAGCSTVMTDTNL